MSRKLAKKSILVICLLFVLVLAGCDLFTGLFDPLIGTWQYSVTVFGITITDTLTYHADNSWTEVVTETGQPDQTYSGTYTHDTKALTLTMTVTTGGSGSMTAAYTISTDRKTLTLTQGTSSTAYTRK